MNKFQLIFRLCHLIYKYQEDNNVEENITQAEVLKDILKECGYNNVKVVRGYLLFHKINEENKAAMDFSTLPHTWLKIDNEVVDLSYEYLHYENKKYCENEKQLKLFIRPFKQYLPKDYIKKMTSLVKLIRGALIDKEYYDKLREYIRNPVVKNELEEKTE